MVLPGGFGSSPVGLDQAQWLPLVPVVQVMVVIYYGLCFTVSVARLVLLCAARQGPYTGA